MSDAAPETPRLPAGARLGNYTITRCIGEGGMGVVYEGVHEGLAKRVAIKTLHAPSARSAELTTRFVREGKAAAKVRHANVVDVFDVAVHEGMPYLVMEYLEGEDLGAFMSHDAPMNAAAIADLIVPVVAALAAAHEAGIVHRDLKPDNIFLTRGKGGGVDPKLVDFGISKLTDGESLHLTGTHAILGTPYYMSPEQAGSSKQVDHRSDIFSLGVILYQCATHELPFKGDSLFQLLGEIMHSEPPPVRSLAERVPPAFEAVIARAMQKDPAKRFQSAAELGA
ncbi:MAG: serine/threonine-protein kinase, partial [Polyangiales bacterium]